MFSLHLCLVINIAVFLNLSKLSCHNIRYPSANFTLTTIDFWPCVVLSTGFILHIDVQGLRIFQGKK